MSGYHVVARDPLVLRIEATTLGELFEDAAFAVFEWRISRAPGPRSRTAVTAGVLLVAGSAAATAQLGITTPDAVVQWTIPAAAIAGAMVLGALPSRR